MVYRTVSRHDSIDGLRRSLVGLAASGIAPSQLRVRAEVEPETALIAPPPLRTTAFLGLAAGTVLGIFAGLVSALFEGPGAARSMLQLCSWGALLGALGGISAAVVRGALAHRDFASQVVSNASSYSIEAITEAIDQR